MFEIIIYLYPMVAFIGLVGYLPQFIAILKSRTPCRSFSIQTWSIWAGTLSVTFAYGILHLQDWPFIIITGVDLAAHLFLIGSVTFKRMKYGKPNQEPDTLNANRSFLPSMPKAERVCHTKTDI